MIKLICINEYGSEKDDIHFKIGETYNAITETCVRYDRYDRHDTELFYSFYTDDCTTIDVSGWHFLTMAEWRNRQIEEILND